MNNGIIVLDRLEKVARQIRTYHSTNDIVMLRHSKNGTVHSLIPADGSTILDQLTVGMFVASETFNSGDSMQIDGTDVTIKLHNSYAIDGLFLAGDCIEVVIDMASSTVFMLNPNAYRQDVLRRWELSPILGTDTGMSIPDDGIYRVVLIGAGCLGTWPLCNADDNRQLGDGGGSTTTSTITQVVSGLGGMGGGISASIYEWKKGKSLSVRHYGSPIQGTGMLNPYYSYTDLLSGPEYLARISQPWTAGYLANGTTLTYPHTRLVSGQVQYGNLYNGSAEYQFTGYDLTMSVWDKHSSNDTQYIWNPPQPGGKTCGWIDRNDLPLILKQYITDEYQDVTTAERSAIPVNPDIPIPDEPTPLSLETTIGDAVEFMGYIYTPVYAPVPLFGEPLLGDRTIHCYGLGGATGIGATYKNTDGTYSGFLRILPYSAGEYTTMNNWGLIIDKLS